MPLVPQYDENIIVGVMYHSVWTWYVSPPWLWILDLERYDRVQGFAKYTSMLGRISYDRPIIIVNEDTAPAYFAYMEEYIVSAGYLSQFVKSRVPIDGLDNTTREERIRVLESISELFPSLVVNFDRHVLHSAFGEPIHISFENHVPSGWEGYYDGTLVYVPEQYKYWVIDGLDYFVTFLNLLK